MSTFFERIDSWWKALAVLVAAIALGVTVGVTVQAVLALPDLVTANSVRISTLEKTDETAQTEREEIKKGIRRLQCLVISERKNLPIEDCF